MTLEVKMTKKEDAVDQAVTAAAAAKPADPTTTAADRAEAQQAQADRVKKEQEEAAKGHREAVVDEPGEVPPELAYLYEKQDKKKKSE